MGMLKIEQDWSGFMHCIKQVAAAGSVPFCWSCPSSQRQLREPTAKTDSDHYYEPLPQETGAAGLKLMLRKLQTTGRLMQVTAHPDDEDGGMLTLEARGKGVSIVLMTLTRGEGGQNKLGSNLFDVLGVLRTLELLASDRYYGVEQRFSRVADFGYSKTPEETFQKWQGHEIALADLVRVIRTFRPDVLIARFSGTDRDGHGHHQASAMLTVEAFRAAADPKRFPEQIAEGLQPWQAKKLYRGNVCGFNAPTCDAASYSVRLNTGVKDPVLGTSYIQFAMKGLRHQQSQGAANWTIDDGDRFTYYKLVDSVVDSPKDSDGHEQDIFDGIDTTLPALASDLGDEESKVPWLRGDLSDIAKAIHESWKVPEDDLQKAAGPLFSAAGLLERSITRLEEAALVGPGKDEILAVLREKDEQIETAISLALNLTVEASAVGGKTADAEWPPEAEAPTTVSPGQGFAVRVKFHNGSKYALAVDRAWMDGLGNKIENIDKDSSLAIPSGKDYFATFILKVPEEGSVSSESTRPYWHRANPETESINQIDDERYVTLPFPSNTLVAHIGFHITGRSDFVIQGWTVRKANGAQAIASANVLVPFVNDKGEKERRPPAIVPKFSVAVEPGEQVVPVQDGEETSVKVGVTSNLLTAASGTLRLQTPEGWRAQPESLPIDLGKRGDKGNFELKVSSSNLKEGRAEVGAVVEVAGKRYTEGYTLVTREDLGQRTTISPPCSE